MKREGVEYLSTFPSTPLIEAAAKVGIRSIVCRQERVGVGIADGYARVTNGRPPSVFAMQYGPGAENAFAGVATAFSDGVPMLLLPMGQPRERDGRFPHFSSVRTYASVTRYVEQIRSAEGVVETMRRAFARLRMGRPGPVMVEIPTDVAEEEVGTAVVEAYGQVRAAVSEADSTDVSRAAEALLKSRNPIIHAGQGVMYAGASRELVEFAELVQIPVMTTLAGKSAFPEKHALSLGSGGSGVMSGPAYHWLRRADLVFGIGTSFTRHGMTTPIPNEKVMIHATNDPIDIGSDYHVEYPIIGDAKLVLRQFIEACSDLLDGKPRRGSDPVTEEVASVKRDWLEDWMPVLTSGQVPITPYRVLWEFMKIADPAETVVTPDSGSTRRQFVAFYESMGPRTHLGWGKSHGLGSGLGLIIGAKLAAPDKFAVNFMGDGAFGMTGLDFETAVRSKIPILTVVFNNSMLAGEDTGSPTAHRLYGTADMGGDYSTMATAMGGWAERVEDPAGIAPAIIRAKRTTEQGQAALLEFITAKEPRVSHA